MGSEFKINSHAAYFTCDLWGVVFKRATGEGEMRFKGRFYSLVSSEPESDVIDLGQRMVDLFNDAIVSSDARIKIAEPEIRRICSAVDDMLMGWLRERCIGYE